MIGNQPDGCLGMGMGRQTLQTAAVISEEFDRPRSVDETGDETAVHVVMSRKFRGSELEILQISLQRSIGLVSVSAQ